MFSESFYVIGMAEYSVAANDPDALRKAEECFELMLKIYRNPELDPYKITPKFYEQTRSARAAAVPMVMVSSAQVLRRCDPEKAGYYTQIVREMADDILKYHYRPDFKCVLENVLADGSVIDNPAGRTINPGMPGQNAWVLMNEAAYSNDKAFAFLNMPDWRLKG